MFFLFPIGTADKPQRQPLATLALIVLFGAAYSVMAWGDVPRQQLLDRWGYIPNEGMAATFLTATFLHQTLGLMALNAGLLWLFGPLLESRLGHIPFLLLFLAGGMVSWAVAGALEQGSHRLAVHVGSSGALAALFGAFIVLYPFNDIRFWYFIFFVYWGLKVGTFRVMGLLVIGLWALAQLAVLATQKQKGPEMVGILSQLGGFAFGALAAAAAFGKEGLQRETTYED